MWSPSSSPIFKGHSIWHQHSSLLLLLLQGGNNYVWSRLTAAGWILTTLANLGLIFLLGWRPRKLRTGGSGPIKY
jgi:hypothetical protein